MGRRTIRNFTFKGDLWKVVDEWAGKYGFGETEKTTSSRTYKGGNIPLCTKSWVKITCAGSDNVTLEAWTRAGWDQWEERLLSGGQDLEIDNLKGFFVIDREMRVLHRNVVNKLMVELGQPAIV